MDITRRPHLLARALIIGVAVLVVVGLLGDAYLWEHNRSQNHVVATGSTGTPLPDATATTPDAGVPPSPVPVPSTSLVADVHVPRLPVYGSPAVGKELAEIPDVNAMGQTEALLIVDDSVPGYYEVEVPVKPNGSEGWVPASGVTVRQDPDYIRVYQSQFRLEWYVGGVLQKAFRVAVGAPSTPTPYGRFYVWASEAFGAPYTPGIFALSGFSPVLDNWPGGGRAGIHGWTDTSIIGRRASHGCVRMAPADFTQLLHTVPLGTPVDILT